MTDAYETYLGGVSLKEDKVLLEEAVTCAHNGALRAAYIMTWLSAAESLKRKFRSLAPQDDTAGKIVGEIRRMESNHQSVDAFLLQKAEEYGFVSDSEGTRLEHVYSMRCLFGHPYEEKPKEEALLAAMSDVVDIVLARPTKLRHGFIGSQVSLLAENPAYLDDLEEAVSRYAIEIHPRIEEDLHAHFIERLLRKLEGMESDASMALFSRRGVWFLRAYLAVDPAAQLGQWDVESSLTRCPRATSFVLADARLWPHLSGRAREMGIGELLHSGETSGKYLAAVQNLDVGEVLTDREVERFQEAVAGLSLAYLASAGIHLRYWAGKVIEALQTYTWPVQNPAAQALQNAGPREIAALRRATQHELGNNVLQAADGKAWGATSLLDAIASGSESWPGAFVAGIVEECFLNDRDEVRFKNGELPRALTCLRSVKRGAARRILLGVAERVREGSVVDPWRASDHSEVLSVLERAQDLEGPALEALRSAIADLEVKENDLPFE